MLLFATDGFGVGSVERDYPPRPKLLSFLENLMCGASRKVYLARSKPFKRTLGARRGESEPHFQ